MTDPWVGQLVDGRYLIEGVIGRGGMGTVYRARHRFTGVALALKLMRDEVVDPELVARFLAEARAPATIGHPAIVAIGDAFRAPTGHLYLAMELLAGRSLRAALGELDAEAARRIGLELLDALAAAHARGFVHRDLKPENIFLAVPGNSVKLLDFGIVKVLGADSRTARGRILGTIEYMAPEQLHDASTVDGRADLWAVGVILYELLAGVRPFGGATLEDKHRALATQEPVPITDVIETTPAVAAFFARALARDRAGRFGSAAEMTAALRELSFGTPSADAGSPVGPTLGSGPRWANPVEAGDPAAPPGTARAAGPIANAPAGAIANAPGTARAAGPIANAPASYLAAANGPGGQHGEPFAHGIADAPAAAGVARVARARPARRWIVALGAIGVVAVGLAIGFAVARHTHAPTATGSEASAAPGASTGSAGASSTTASTGSAGASSTTAATGSSPASSGGSATGSAATQAATGGSCATTCDRLAACKLALGSCTDDCNHHLMQLDCIDKATRCEQLAACVWSAMCERYPKMRDGQLWCANGRVCMAACGGDVSCQCACGFSQRPRSKLVFVQWRLCELQAGADLAQRNALCRAQIDACESDTR